MTDMTDPSTLMQLLARVLTDGGNRNEIAAVLAERYVPPLPGLIYLSPYVATVVTLAVGEGYVRRLMAQEPTTPELMMAAVATALTAVNAALAVQAHPDRAARTIAPDAAELAEKMRVILEMLLADPHTYVKVSAEGGLDCARWEAMH